MSTALVTYGTSAAATHITTAGKLATTTGGTAGVTTSVVGTATGYGEITALGTTNAWAGLGSMGAPTGNGWLLNAATLQGQQILAGNWTPEIKSHISSGSLIANIYINAYAYDTSNSTYTLIGTMELDAQTFTTTATFYTLPATALAAFTFNATQYLYLDCWLNVTSNSSISGATITMNQASTGAAGIANVMQMTTPGYVTLTIMAAEDDLVVSDSSAALLDSEPVEALSVADSIFLTLGAVSVEAISASDASLAAQLYAPADSLSITDNFASSEFSINQMDSEDDLVATESLFVTRSVASVEALSAVDTFTSSEFSTNQMSAEDDLMGADSFVATQMALPVDALSATDSTLATELLIKLHALTLADSLLTLPFALPVDALFASDSLSAMDVTLPLEALSVADAGGLGTALTVYGSNVACGSNLTNAGQLSHSGAGGVEGNTTTQLGMATGYGEVVALGTASAWAGSVSMGGPTGLGWLLNSSLLQNQQLLAGNWSPTITVKYSDTNGGSTMTASLYVNFYAYDTGNGTYTLIGTSSLLNQAFTVAKYTLTLNNFTLAQPFTFNATQRLYLDCWFDVTANTGSSAASLIMHLSNNGGVGVTGDLQVGTPGYVPSGVIIGQMSAEDDLIALDGCASLQQSVPVEALSVADGLLLTESAFLQDALAAADSFTGGSLTLNQMSAIDAIVITESGSALQDVLAVEALPVTDLPLAAATFFPVDVAPLTDSFASSEVGVLITNQMSAEDDLVATDGFLALQDTVPVEVLLASDGNAFASSVLPGETLPLTESLAATRLALPVDASSAIDSLLATTLTIRSHALPLTDTCTFTGESGPTRNQMSAEDDLVVLESFPYPISPGTTPHYPDSPYGVAILLDFFTGPPEYLVQQSIVNQCAALPVSWVKLIFSWSRVETTQTEPPTYTFPAELDETIQRFNAAGINVQYDITNPPLWRRSQPWGTVNGVTYSYASAYEMNAFAVAVATRYRTGSANGVISAIQIGNEDYDSSGIVKGNDQLLNGGWAADALVACYANIKAIDPNMLVCAGAHLRPGVPAVESWQHQLNTGGGVGGNIGSGSYRDITACDYYAGNKKDPDVQVNPNVCTIAEFLADIHNQDVADGLANMDLRLTEVGYAAVANPGQNSNNITYALQEQYGMEVVQAAYNNPACSHIFLYTMDYADNNSLVLSSSSVTPLYTAYQSFIATYPQWQVQGATLIIGQMLSVDNIPAGDSGTFTAKSSGSVTLNQMSATDALVATDSGTFAPAGSVTRNQMSAEDDLAAFDGFTARELAPFSEYAPIVASAVPDAWYRLGDLSGTVADDSSGNGYNGTITGTVTEGEPGAILSDQNAAMLFDGATGAITLPSGLSPAGWSRFSAEYCFNLSSTAFTNQPTVLANAIPAVSHTGISLWVDRYASGLHAMIGNGTTYADATAAISPVAGTWYYVAVTWDGATITLYVNGEVMATAALSGTIASTTGPLTIAHNPAGSADYFPGLLDEVAVYSYTLSPFEVSEHYTLATSNSSRLAGSLPGQTLVNGVSNYLFGTNTPNYNTDLLTMPALQQDLQAAGITVIRCSLADSNGVNYSDTVLDEMAAACESVGAAMLGILRYSDGTFDQHAVTYLGSRCNLYEFSNEPDLNSITYSQYLAAWNTIIPECRAINPHAAYIGPALGAFSNVSSYLIPWLQGCVTSGVLPDAISFHDYPCTSDSSIPESTCRLDAPGIGTSATSLRATIAHTLGYTLPICVTEWNIDAYYGDSHAQSYSPNTPANAAFIEGFTLDALDSMAQNGVTMACEFELNAYLVDDAAPSTQEPQLEAMATQFTKYLGAALGTFNAEDDLVTVDAFSAIWQGEFSDIDDGLWANESIFTLETGTFIESAPGADSLLATGQGQETESLFTTDSFVADGQELYADALNTSDSGVPQIVYQATDPLAATSTPIYAQLLIDTEPLIPGESITATDTLWAADAQSVADSLLAADSTVWADRASATDTGIFVDVPMNATINPMNAEDSLLAQDGFVAWDTGPFAESLPAADSCFIVQINTLTDTLAMAESFLAMQTDACADSLVAAETFFAQSVADSSEMIVVSENSLTTEATEWIEALAASDVFAPIVFNGMIATDVLTVADTLLASGQDMFSDALLLVDDAATQASTVFPEPMAGADVFQVTESASSFESLSVAESLLAALQPQSAEMLVLAESMGVQAISTATDAIPVAETMTFAQLVAGLEPLIVSESIATTDTYQPIEVASLTESLLATQTEQWQDVITAADVCTPIGLNTLYVLEVLPLADTLYALATGSDVESPTLAEQLLATNVERSLDLLGASDLCTTAEVVLPQTREIVCIVVPVRSGQITAAVNTGVVIVQAAGSEAV